MMFLLAFILPLAFACPEVQDPHCSTTEFMCPGGLDPQGCQMPGGCIPQFNTVTDSDGQPCMNVCPVHCGLDHVPCPNPMDSNGCPAPPTCMHNPIDAPCPFICPLQCTGNDVLCPGPPAGPNGCPMPGYCATTCLAA